MAEPILLEQPKPKPKPPSVLNPIFNQPAKPGLTAQQIQDQSANPAVGTTRKVPVQLPVDLSYIDKDLYSPDQVKLWNGQNITKLMQMDPATLKAIQLDFDSQRKAEEARPIGNPLTDGPGAREQNLRRIAAKQDLIREALLHSSSPKPMAPVATPVTPAKAAPVVAKQTAPVEAPFVGETAPLQTPPVASQTAGPLKEIVAKNPGVDWDKIGQIAKDTGMGILGVLQAALAGRTAGLEGRHLDMSADTYIGKQNDIKEAQKEKQSERDWQSQLAEIDRDFTAQQNQLNQEFQAAMSAAKTDEEKQAAQLDYQQRLKELDITGKQRMNEIAASKGTAKQPVNLDPRGLNL